MRKIVLLSVFSLLALIVGCARTPEIEKLAMARLPAALQTAMQESMSVAGGMEITEPEILYSCDSLCIIQFKAVANAPEMEGYSFPARYAFVRDVVLSHAYGHPVYSEKLTGCPEMSKKEIKEKKARLKKEADKLYAYYSSTASLVP